MKKYFGIVERMDGTMYTGKSYASEKTFSNWANRQYLKDHTITIYQYEIDMNTFDTKLISTWHE